MATYRFLEDHFIAGRIFLAGTIATTADVGGLLPANWIPTPNVDPLDTDAVNAFYAAGPAKPGLSRQQWTGIYVASPATYWLAVPQGDVTKWTLTGLGSSLAPRWN